MNDYTSGGTFVAVGSGGMLVAAHDNIFAGMGTVFSTALSADNLSGVDPMFVNASMYDYHLKMGSPAIGKGVAEGSAGSFSLVPVFEYVDPVSGVPRLTAKDLGAFEYGTNVTNPSQDAGAETPDGAVSASSSSGGGSGSGSGGAGSGSGGGSGSSSGSAGGSGGSSGAAGGSGSGGGGDAGANGEQPESSASSGCGCVTAGNDSGTGLGLLGMGVAFATLLAARARKRR